MGRIYLSVIIPQKNSVTTLPRLISSIPDDNRIEIIVVDNSEVPITKEEIDINRSYKLLWSPPSKYAGGARNLGIDNSTGEWIVFADADDFFSKDAFDVFLDNINSDSDIIYFKSEGIYPETGEYSPRAELYARFVEEYVRETSEALEQNLRQGILVPWGKMFKSSFIKNNGFKFDEVLASNDVFFSTLTGFYANKISANSHLVYYVTVTKGSLMNRRDKAALKARLLVTIKRNNFLKQNGFAASQTSVMKLIRESSKCGIFTLIEFVYLTIKNKQNPFVGYKNWYRTWRRILVLENKDKGYFTH